MCFYLIINSIRVLVYCYELNCLSLLSVDFDRTCWTLFPRRVVGTKFGIYVYIIGYNVFVNCWFVLTWKGTCVKSSGCRPRRPHNRCVQTFFSENATILATINILGTSNVYLRFSCSITTVNIHLMYSIEIRVRGLIGHGDDCTTTLSILQNLPHLYNVFIRLISNGLKPFLWPICAFVSRVGSIVGFPFLLNEYFE